MITGMRRGVMTGVLLMALAACGSSSKASATATPTTALSQSPASVTVTPTPSPTLSPTPSPTPQSLAQILESIRQQYDLPAGYPMVVERSAIDPRFAANLQTDQVVNPYPGVYQNFPTGGNLSEVIASDGTVGYCSQIKLFQAASGNNTGYSCF